MRYRQHTLVLLLVFSAAGLLVAQQYNPPSREDEFERQYQERIKQDRLSGIYIPRNLDDALAQLNKLTSEESRRQFRAIPEDTVCQIMHNRLGQWMIANWSFYEGSRLSNYLRSAGVTYPDDMADFLILAFHRQLNGHTVSIKELAVYFKEKRKKQWEQERLEGEVLKEEVRKVPKPEGADAPPETPAQPAAKPAKTTPKGPGGKQ
ncbi:MAG: hypothetical protein IPM98_13865 [Lewinellaceae bacterium]|nr:hypothetical protein [Lewinellaceae bacterium]